MLGGNRFHGDIPCENMKFEESLLMVQLSKNDFTQEELRQKVYLNCVGTFGVTSAGYWWGRAGGAIIRMTHYLLGHEFAVWALLYSDDGMVTSGREDRHYALLLHLFVLVILQVPLSWKKVRGGVEAERIGYWLDMPRFELGSSTSRAARGPRRSRASRWKLKVQEWHILL